MQLSKGAISEGEIAMTDWRKNIKERRLELKMSQTDLAKKVGYSDKSMVSQIESGKTDIPIEKFEQIAKALRTTPQELLTHKQGYYFDPEVAEMAQRAYEDPDTRLLLSASRDLSKEDMQYVLDLVKRLKGGEL